MDFINQVKKLKDLTKSPEVRQICENYLNGGSQMTESQVLAALNEQASVKETMPELGKHWDSIKKEQMDASKKAASALMESWGGINKRTSLNNSGTYISEGAKSSMKEDSLLESLKEAASNDKNAESFVEAHGLKNMGLLESIHKIKSLSIYEYPKVKIVCEQYANLIVNKQVPEFSLLNNFIAELNNFKWDSSILPIIETLSEKSKKYSREIEVSKVLESIKKSGNSSFYSDLSESLNNWLISENKSSGLLSREISKWSFNPIVRNLINYLNVSESEETRSLEIPSVSQGESRIGRVFSPILIEGERTLFVIGNSIFESSSNELRKLGAREMTSVPSDYISLVNSTLRPYVKITEGCVSIQLGKKNVSIIEENTGTSVYLGKSKLNFRSVPELAKILGLESASHFGINESQVVGDIINLYVNFSNIVELDFAKNISSNIYEGVSVNLIKWNNEIYLQRINEAMRENSVYKVNGSQAVKMVKDFLRYDISEGLTEFLEGEQKLKSIMINDRTKVLENISKVEGEISKIESLMENNPLYAASKEMKNAHVLLNNELSVLREKWNQINIEISRLDETPEVLSDLSEDEKFNIGDYVKIKESGETGKIISVDGTSGRYTVLLDNGKTSDFLVNEITDLEEALSQAAEKNQEEAGENKSDEEGSEEVKESNNFNKSELSEEDQKKILKNFSDGHSFSKAPGADNEEIKMEIDSVHGYNLTMNEGKGDKKETQMAKAPGNNAKVKGKVEGEDLLDDKAPETKPKDKTEFDGKDADGKNSEIGYNLREGAESEGDMVEAPESGKPAKETSNVKTLDQFMNLAKAPGQEGDIDFEVNDDMGYNITESDELKKN